MNSTIREIILTNCAEGEQVVPAKFDPINTGWKVGKLLSYGITSTGFPFVVWETTNFGTIDVGPSRKGDSPQSSIRNDASSGVFLNDLPCRMRSAERMSKEIVY